MKIIVAGCGRAGASLAKKFSLEGHDVVVVDKDPTAFELLGKNFRGATVKGMVFDGEALKKAGIDKADAFVSVTSGDNSNVVSATIAKDIYRVPKVIARIYEPRRAEIYRRFGIPTVSSVTWATNEIHALLTHTEVIRDATLGNGEVQIVRTDIPQRLVGRAVEDVSVPGEIMVISMIRGGRAKIPSSGEIFQEQDNIELAVLTTSLPRLKKLLAL
jgi:trk system potassium uptake protein TrkA